MAGDGRRPLGGGGAAVVPLRARERPALRGHRRRRRGLAARRRGSDVRALPRGRAHAARRPVRDRRLSRAHAPPRSPRAGGAISRAAPRRAVLDRHDRAARRERGVRHAHAAVGRGRGAAPAGREVAHHQRAVGVGDRGVRVRRARRGAVGGAGRARGRGGRVRGAATGGDADSAGGAAALRHRGGGEQRARTRGRGAR